MLALQAEQSIGNYPPGTGARCLPRPQNPHAIFICLLSVDRTRLSRENRGGFATSLRAALRGDVPEVVLGMAGTMPGVGDRGSSQPCLGIELIYYKMQHWGCFGRAGMMLRMLTGCGGGHPRKLPVPWRTGKGTRRAPQRRDASEHCGAQGHQQLFPKSQWGCSIPPKPSRPGSSLGLAAR